MIETYPYFLLKDDEPFRLEFIINNTHKIITLPAKAKDDLKWDAQILQLEESLSASQKVLIKMDLGLEDEFSESDELGFNSYILAVEELNKKIITRFKDIIDGVIFYDGSVQLENICHLEPEDITGNIHQNLSLIYKPHMKQRLAAAAILGSILHRLVAFLDDAIFGFCIFADADAMDLIDRGVFFSKERFDHIFVICHNHDYQYLTLDYDQGLSSLGYYSMIPQKKPKDIKLGLLLPSDASLTPKAYDLLKNKMIELKAERKTYRLICEKIFNESWNDLESVIYNPEATHPMTQRMIKGFEASGGQAIHCG